MKNKLISCLVCFIIIGTILISGCTQFQSKINTDNTTSPKLNLSSDSEREPPPTPERLTHEEGPPVPE